MAQLNPELAKSTPSDVLPSPDLGRPGSVYNGVDPPGAGASRHASISSRRSMYGVTGDPNDDPDADDDVPTGQQFTFIPPNPKRYYKRLVEFCLVADLEVMLSPEVDDNDEVSLGILSSPHIELINECALRWRVGRSLGILSPPHIQLINECALRWRIGHSYRAACFLDLVKQFYERNDVPMECIPEALQNVTKVIQENELEYWPVQDVSLTMGSNHFMLTLFQVDYISGTYAGLFNIFLSSLYHSMDNIPNLKISEIQSFLTVLEHVRDSGLLERFDVDIGARIHDVQDRVRQVSAHWYEVKMQEFTSAPGVNRALPLLLMTDEIEKAAKLLDKRFPEPLLGYVGLLNSAFHYIDPEVQEIGFCIAFCGSDGTTSSYGHPEFAETPV